jgi:hypothetical protein
VDVCYQISRHTISRTHKCPRRDAWVTSFTAKPCKGEKSSWRFQIGTKQLNETILTENIDPPGLLGVGRGAENSSLEKKVTKTEEATVGRIILH